MAKRRLFPIVVVVLVALAAFILNRGADAQDPATQGHPLVGTWLVDTDPGSADNSPDTVMFSSDGTFVQSEAGGGAQLGAWEATGERSAVFTFVGADVDEEGSFLGSLMIRASLETSDDGNTFTADFTIEFIQPDGTGGGQAGPGIASGERLVVEAPGTPVITFEELFAAREGQPGVATPAP